MKKTYIIALCIGAILLTVFIQKSTPQEVQVHKVGVIVPLSGPAAKMGEEVLRSIKLKKTPYIELVVEDDQCSAKNALSAYEKLNAEGVDVFYIACSGSVMSVYPKAQMNNDVILTAYAGSIEIRKTDDTVIRLNPDGLSIVESIQKYIDGLGDSERVYVVYENADYPKSVAEELKKNNPNFIFDTYKSDDVDFKSLVLRMKQSRIDTFLTIPVSDSAYKLLLTEMKKNNLKGMMVGDVNVCDYTFSPSEYGFPTTCWKARLSKDKTDVYQNLFTSTYGTQSNYTFYNALTTDMFTYLDGMAKGNRFSAKEIKSNLIALGFNGTYGSYKFTPDGEIHNSKDYLKKIDR
jgi:ABC-type branched-subunit amino acid transport system substrate-binding protein